jgi:short-subunit dehydrogenase
VNNAGLSIYGKLTDVPLEDKRRLFDVNFWGVVHGCRTAVLLMRHTGGVLINLGSELSDIAIPLQGIYSASKHAVKGYTDALRMELEHDDIPIAVTLVKPSAINTPYPEHARNYLEEGVPALPTPMYAPEVVARAILHCAERPVRDVVIGGGGRLQIAFGRHAPRLTDKLIKRSMFDKQKTFDRDHVNEGNLERPQADGRTWGPHKGHVMRSSMYTRAALSPMLKTMAFAAAGLTLAAGVRRLTS